MNLKPKVVLLLVVSSFVHGQQTPFLQTPDPNKQWKLQSNLSDEFNSSSIDWTNKWNISNNLPNVSAWKWNNNSNVKIVNNAAEIKMSHNTNNVPVDGTYFNSGILKSIEYRNLNLTISNFSISFFWSISKLTLNL